MFSNPKTSLKKNGIYDLVSRWETPSTLTVKGIIDEKTNRLQKRLNGISDENVALYQNLNILNFLLLWS